MSLQTVGKQAKYGLISKKKPRLGQNQSVFQVADEDEEDGNDIQKASREMFKSKDLKLDDIDSSIYDYDGEYDNMKRQREAEVKSQLSSLNSTNPSSRYIENLKATAKVREREKERIFEKILLKERKEEDELYSDKPKFITAAYKEKLKESQKWEYEDKLAEQLEKKQDVRTKGMQGFYANLLTKNISMGNDVESNALSAYTTGSERQKKLDTSNESTNNKSIPLPVEKKSETTDPGRDSQSAITSTTNESIQKNVERASTSSDSQESVLTPSTATTTTNKTETRTTKSTEERISEAKQRYLARKRVLQEISTVNATNE